MKQPGKNFQIVQLDDDGAKRLRHTMDKLRTGGDIKPPRLSTDGIAGTGVVMTYEGSDMSAEDLK